MRHKNSAESIIMCAHDLAVWTMFIDLACTAIHLEMLQGAATVSRCVGFYSLPAPDTMIAFIAVSFTFAVAIVPAATGPAGSLSLLWIGCGRLVTASRASGLFPGSQDSLLHKILTQQFVFGWGSVVLTVWGCGSLKAWMKVIVGTSLCNAAVSQMNCKVILVS